MGDGKKLLPVLVAALVALTGVKTGAASEPVSGKAQYDHCLSRAATSPKEPLSEALELQKTGGGPASDHCLAVALVGLHRYGEAAARLDGLAHGGFTSDPSMPAAPFDQAGNASLLAGRADQAAPAV